MQGYAKIAVGTLPVSVGDPRKNAKIIVDAVKQADNQGAQVLVLPELCVTGYSMGDLFAQKILLNSAKQELLNISRLTQKLDICFVIGLPIALNGRLYNCAAVLQSGKILGIVPKMCIPNHHEFYERRWFDSGVGVKASIKIGNDYVPFGKMLFELDESLVVGVEICEDLWVTIPPSSKLSMLGANVIVNLSASNELVSKNYYREELIKQQSARCLCAYAYASCGVHESTTDVVFSGACFIAENGHMLAKTKRFSRKSEIAYACVDLEALDSERRLSTGMDKALVTGDDVLRVQASLKQLEEKYFERKIDKHPFVPSDPNVMRERCEEILSIQSAGLAKRLEHVGTQKATIGISGGLDSTLALLVIVRAFEDLGYSLDGILAMTMPGFGTTDHTYSNAVKLMNLLGVCASEINIVEACLQHFKDIGHDKNVHDVTYENVQARERTQILMDISNMNNAILVGTGDLSEMAMGWATFNGDHMSMYGVNASVPKTLVRYLVAYEANRLGGEIKDVLQSVLDTPVTPELLPPDVNGDIAQFTEQKIGPYELHDFFLYNVIRFGARPEKIKFLANIAFEDKYSKDEISKWLGVFLKRFFNNQFKRSSLPDGPKVGSISLSPRGDWRMPSDADGSLWWDTV